MSEDRKLRNRKRLENIYRHVEKIKEDQVRAQARRAEEDLDSVFDKWHEQEQQESTSNQQ